MKNKELGLPYSEDGMEKVLVAFDVDGTLVGEGDNRLNRFDKEVLDKYFTPNAVSQLKAEILKEIIGEDTPTPVKSKHDHCAFCGELNTHSVSCLVQIENDLKAKQRAKLSELFNVKEK